MYRIVEMLLLMNKSPVCAMMHQTNSVSLWLIQASVSLNQESLNHGIIEFKLLGRKYCWSVFSLREGYFNFSLLGGSGQKSWLLFRLFDFAFLVQNILKEGDSNFVFKVLATVGDYKHNKDIKKLWKKNGFFFIEGG